MTGCRVTFRDKWRDISVDLPAEPLLVPPELRLVSRSPEEVLLGTPTDTEELGADILAGSVPLVYLSGDHPKVAWLDIPPPAPLTLEDLSLMWQQLVDIGLPTPSPANAQGRGPWGRLQAHERLLAEYLEIAHRLSRALLARWPVRRGIQVRWQHLELPGGREDPVLTARQAARFAAIPTRRGDLPARSARRVAADPAWGSHALANAARRAANLVLATEWLGETNERQILTRPFLDIADRAACDPNRPDPPLSSWPVPARQLFDVLVALGAVAAATTDQRAARAPLCLVWRLYEAWVASEVLLGLDHRPDATRTELLTDQPGYEWLARWSVPGGNVIACAQLRLSSEPVDLDGRLPRGVQSITSTLIPDVSAFFVRGNAMTYVAIDAKRRSSAVMKAEDAAEAASKYVWGLRFDRNDGEEPGVNVQRTIIATTARPPAMFSGDSRIHAEQITPGSPGDLGTVICAALGLYI